MLGTSVCWAHLCARHICVLGTSVCSAHLCARHICVLGISVCAAHLCARHICVLGTSVCSAHLCARHICVLGTSVIIPWRHIFLSRKCQLSDTDRPSGMIIGCVVAQVAGRRILTAETQVRSQANQCVTCGGQQCHWDRCNSDYFGFPLSLPFHKRSTLIFTYTLLLPEGQEGKAWEPSKKLCSIGNREHWLKKRLYFLNCGHWTIFDVELCAPHFGVQEPSSGTRFKNI